MTTTLYIVRHGESGENTRFLKKSVKTKKIFLNDLTKTGEKQVRELVVILRGAHLDVVYSSHLKRAKHTASIIAGSRGLTVAVSRDLQERKIRLDKESEQKLWYEPKILYGDPDVLRLEEMWNWKPFKNMESEGEAMQRFIHAIQNICKKHADKKVLVVTHGQIMRAFLVYIGFGTFKTIPLIREGSIKNAAYICVDIIDGKFLIRDLWGVNILPHT